MAKGIIVIDPGHGGTEDVGNSGWNHAISALGDLEKNLTLEVGQYAKAELEILQHTVFLTRDTDVNLSLKDRAATAKNRNADAFVSIHFNGMSDSSIQGTETFVHVNSNQESKLLASSLQTRLLSVTGYRDRGVKTSTFGVLFPNYHLYKTASAYLEISFITEPNEAQRLKDIAYKRKLGKAIAVAIDDYINKRSRITPITPTPFLELYLDTKALNIETDT